MNTVGPKEQNTRQGLELLLEILASDERDSAYQYEFLRLKTLRFFQWKGAIDAEELTDETLVRVGRKLGEGAPVGKAEIGPYVRGVARMVFLESLRNEERERKILEQADILGRIETDIDLERQIRCLEVSLADLDQPGRDLIIGYYSDSGEGKIAARRRMADALGISMTALRIRAHRLRERLSSSVTACLEAALGETDLHIPS